MVGNLIDDVQRRMGCSRTIIIVRSLPYNPVERKSSVRTLFDYVKPQNIQEDKDVRVVLFKERRLVGIARGRK